MALNGPKSETECALLATFDTAREHDDLLLADMEQFRMHLIVFGGGFHVFVDVHESIGCEI